MYSNIICLSFFPLFSPSSGKFKYDKLVKYNSIFLHQTGQISRINHFLCVHTHTHAKGAPKAFLKRNSETKLKYSKTGSTSHNWKDRKRESHSKTHHLQMPHPCPSQIAYLACISVAQQEASCINNKSMEISFSPQAHPAVFCITSHKNIKIIKRNLKMTL